MCCVQLRQYISDNLCLQSVQFTLRVSLYTDMCTCNRLMILMRTSLERLQTKSAQDTCSQTHMSHSRTW